MSRVLILLALLIGFVPMAQAQTLQDLLRSHADEVASPGRRTVGVLIDDLAASDLPQVGTFLEHWQDKSVWQSPEGLFFIAREDGANLTLTDIDTGAETTVPKDGYSQIKPNGGVRGVIGTALVQFQLMEVPRINNAHLLFLEMATETEVPLTNLVYSNPRLTSLIHYLNTLPVNWVEPEVTILYSDFNKDLPA